MIALISWAAAGVVVGAAAINDAPTAHGFVGADLSAHADQAKGFGWTGRAAVGWDFLGAGPGGITEIGGMMVVPAEDQNTTIRLGLGVRAVHVVRDLRLPVQSQNRPDGENRHGINPSAYLQSEFVVGNPETPFVIGGQVGFTTWGSRLPSCGESLSDAECIAWPLSPMAAATARKTFRSGLTIHGHVGTHLSLGVAWRLGRKD